MVLEALSPPGLILERETMAFFLPWHFSDAGLNP